MRDSAARFPLKLLRAIFLAGCMCLPGVLWAQELTVTGGTSAQRQLTSCIEQISAEDLNRLPGRDHSITIVILERERFLQAKDSFGAYRTKLAFSNLAMRRMYLSSDVFRDMDNVLRCIPHELGHFVTRSPYENPAEIAARSIRQTALKRCTMPLEPVSPGTLSSQANSMRLDGTE
jgi:hypothetical protein